MTTLIRLFSIFLLIAGINVTAQTVTTELSVYDTDLYELPLEDIINRVNNPLHVYSSNIKKLNSFCIETGYGKELKSACTSTDTLSAEMEALVKAMGEGQTLRITKIDAMSVVNKPVTVNDISFIVIKDNTPVETPKSAAVVRPPWKPYKVEALGYLFTDIERVNTVYNDYAPAYFDKNYVSLVFSTDRKAKGSKRRKAGTLFILSKDSSGNWNKELETTPFGDICVGRAFWCKTTNMYYTVNLGGDKAKNQIYSVKLQGSDMPPENITKETWSMPANVENPSLTMKEDTIYFDSDLPGGLGGFDIWYTVYDKKKRKWSAPVNMGEKVNTPGDEKFPFIRNNGELYFSSEREGGKGGLDIYVLDKQGNLKPLEAPFNSEYNDSGIVFDPEGNGMFASDRLESKGGYDIYTFNKPKVKGAPAPKKKGKK
jgi:hypothetical protein